MRFSEKTTSKNKKGDSKQQIKNPHNRDTVMMYTKQFPFILSK